MIGSAEGMNAAGIAPRFDRVQNVARVLRFASIFRQRIPSAGPVFCSSGERVFNPLETLMPKLIRSRNLAYIRQSGRCFYCSCPMWRHDLNGFAERHGLSMGEARGLQCTAEHLRARMDGGNDDESNIVAACYICNTRRHARKRPLEPEAYKRFVQKKLALGCWHSKSVLKLRAQSDRRRCDIHNVDAPSSMRLLPPRQALSSRATVHP